MRNLLIAIVIIGALASIALCASFGWDQATVLKDQVTQAFVYGFVALATLGLHVLALRAWVSGWRRSGGFIGIVAMLAFVMTAFTSLGGLASRSDKVIAARQDVLDTKADTKRQIDDLAAERAGLKFTRTTQAAVDAGKQAADAAEKARDQECGKVGDNCRRRQDAVASALAAYAKAQENKASTDRFDEIEAELKHLRAAKSDGPVGAADPMKALLGTILGASVDLLTAWQKAVFAVIYDLTLVAFMIGIEVLGHLSVPKTRSEDVSAKPDTSTPIVLPRPQKPKLVATSTAPVGSVKNIITAALESAPGARVEIADLGERYRDVCRSEGKLAASMDTFLKEVEALCKVCDIKRRSINGHLYLLGVKLVTKSAAAQEAT